MRRRRRREESDSLNLSFLDAISCGFGAIILLLVITLLFEPATIQETRADVQGLIERLQKELFEIRGETRGADAGGQRARRPTRSRCWRGSGPTSRRSAASTRPACSRRPRAPRWASCARPASS